MSPRLLAAALLAPALLAPVATPALAQDLSQLPDRPIRRAEVVAAIKRQFAAMDTNHDGVITPDEFQHYRAIQPRATGLAALTYVSSTWFEHVDANGDGRITYAEASDRPLKLFDLADVNGDGVVSTTERSAALALMSLTGH